MIGFTLGKFLPPHNGHLHLIREGAKQVDRMYVLMCSLEREPIPGYLRHRWLAETFADEPNVRIVHVTDENPQEPIEHPDFWRIWAGTFDRNLPEKPDIFFSSETYGDDLQRELGIRHVLVDLERRVVPVSARHIRNDPFGNWRHIPEAVRPYYVRKVVLSGPESVGKSKLAARLAQHFNTAYLPEYGREYYEQVAPDFRYPAIGHIAGGHLLREEEALRQADKILFLDTDLIMTQVWSEIYFGRCPEWVLGMNHLPRQRAHLHLLLKPDVPWVNDGTRNYGENRDEQFEHIRQELEKRRLRYVVIDGDFEERFSKAVEAVKKHVF